MPAAQPRTPSYVDRQLTAVERRGADRLGTSWPQIPQFHVRRDMTFTPMIEHARHLAEISEDRVSLTALLVHTVARVLANHPRLNATFRGESIRCFSEINIGVAVATDGGLVVPVIAGSDRVDIGDVARELERLRNAAAMGQLHLADMTAGTFTISNLGMFGVDSVDPVVNPPQTAILGVGRARSVLRESACGGVVTSQMATVTLGVDHRAADGATAARFLSDLAAAVEG